MQDGFEDISQRTPTGDFDYVRAKEGGLSAPFMSIYVPAGYQTEGGAKELADELIDLVESFEQKWPDKFAVARSTADVREQFAKGLISLPLGMENGAPLEGKLENLQHFADRGIRYITLTHGKWNAVGDSSYDEERKWHGLSPFGKQVVAEMNRLGVMVDISHVSDETFYDVVEVAAVPVIASHSSCRTFTPGFERNMDDDMIQALADNGGVIMINFGSPFLSGEISAKTRHREHLEAHFKENGWERTSDEARAYARQYRIDNGLYADVGIVADHIDHVVSLVGVDHVGLGSDFDGVGDTLPTGLKDVSQYPNLIEELLGRGYSPDDIQKICGENLLRVWAAVEAFAAASAS